MLNAVIENDYFNVETIVYCLYILLNLIFLTPM